MASNKEKAAKGLRFLLGALPLLFIGPVVITIGFRAINDNNYFWFILGGVICLAGIALGFIGIRTILKGLFNE